MVTYATHSNGLFPKLVRNAYNVPVTVLGWGKSWKGFMDQLRAVPEFCSKVPQSDLVIFLDGFDSVINRHPDGAVARFLAIDPPTGILVSVEPGSGMERWFMAHVFGSNYTRCMINSGMYMGYAGPLRSFLSTVLQQSTSDDQRAFNNSCDLVNRDYDTVTFLNLPQKNPLGPCPNVSDLDSPFVSLRGSMGCRAPHDRLWASLRRSLVYFPEMYVVLCVVVVVVVVVVLVYRSRRRCIMP